jgi:HK97 gp10 family phage protein
MASTPDVMGIGDLGKKFVELKQSMVVKVARSMVAAGARPIRDEAKAIHRANGSVRTGATVKNIVMKRETRAPQGTAEMHIGVRHGKHLTKKQKAGATLQRKGSRITTKNANDPWYWFLVEYTGARPHHIGRGSYLARKGRIRSKQKGKMHPGFRPRPFLKPALERRRADAIKAMEARLDRELAKFK